MSDHSMKRTYFPGITDVVVVTDPAEIRTISNDSRLRLLTQSQQQLAAALDGATSCALNPVPCQNRR
jgi:hypothetical protein